MTIQKALRLQKLPPYVFAAIDEKKKKLMAAGVDLIDLGMGDPDLPTPPAIIETLIQKAKIPACHRYPPYGGIAEFKKTAAEWMEKRFSIKLDASNEILALIGSKEGIAHFTEAFVNPGDFTLIPDPGYPVYANATILAGGTPLFYPLLWENKFCPDWSKISEEVWRSIKVVYINYPHNPTSAVASLDTYAELVALAKKHKFIICSDGAYSEQGYQSLPSSVLQVPGAKDHAIEFFSMSKSYNMTGWRVGFAAGNKDLIAGLYHLKATVDTGIFQPIQWAAITAMTSRDEEVVQPSREVFSYRRKLMIEGLQAKGYDVFDGGATFYLWIRCPKGILSAEVASQFLEKGVVVTPGYGFGNAGEGYFRMTLTVPEEKLREVLNRIPNAS